MLLSFMCNVWVGGCNRVFFSYFLVQLEFKFLRIFPLIGVVEFVLLNDIYIIMCKLMISNCLLICIWLCLRWVVKVWQLFMLTYMLKIQKVGWSLMVWNVGNVSVCPTRSRVVCRGLRMFEKEDLKLAYMLDDRLRERLRLDKVLHLASYTLKLGSRWKKSSRVSNHWPMIWVEYFLSSLSLSLGSVVVSFELHFIFYWGMTGYILFFLRAGRDISSVSSCFAQEGHLGCIFMLSLRRIPWAHFHA